MPCISDVLYAALLCENRCSTCNGMPTHTEAQGNLICEVQGDLGLNICEAHAFNTSDRFSLDIFVVDGWKPDGSKESLEQALSSRFAQVAPASQPPREQQPAGTVEAAATAADRRRWVRSL